MLVGGFVVLLRMLLPSIFVVSLWSTAELVGGDEIPLFDTTSLFPNPNNFLMNMALAMMILKIYDGGDLILMFISLTSNH